MGISLPEAYQRSMRSYMTESEYDAYLDSLCDQPVSSLHVNTLKITPERLRDLLDCDLEKIAWTDNGFYFDPDQRLSKDPYYYAGLYYLQEASAMIPASYLPVKPGDRVLDLCAAPGGKSTQLGAKLKGEGILIANDISASRCRALLKNLEMAGITNFCVTCETPEHLRSVYPEYFDHILVDAPCSGEGMFRSHPDTVKDWEKHGPDHYGPLQRKILNEAVLMLKPGGYIAYSTCTFSKYEDEDVISDILKAHPKMHIVPIEGVDGAASGIGLYGCIRLYPFDIKGEGHFLCLLKKDGSESGDLPLHNASDDITERLCEKDGYLNLLPDGFTFNEGIRYMRTGLNLGIIRDGRFEPSQAFAMALTPEDFPLVVSLDHDDERVIRYLKGETITVDRNDDITHDLAIYKDFYDVSGWALVCVGRYPLGFAKRAGDNLKNKYNPGWRWM